MSAFTAVDISKLPPPPVIETLVYEDILADLKAYVAEAAPELAPVLGLESEPAVKVIELVAYCVMILRARVNDAGKAVMLPFATDGDLDNLAVLFGVARLTISEGDPEAVPPIPAEFESDAALRKRTQLALEGFSTAGTLGGYIFHAFSADGRIVDVSVTSPAPTEVNVRFFATEADGTPTDAPLTAIEAALNVDDVRPLTDFVTVAPATIVPFNIEATLYLSSGPAAQLAEVEARLALDAALLAARRIGQPVPLSAIYAALHRPGVEKVTLEAPLEDVAVTDIQIALADTVTIGVAP